MCAVFFDSESNVQTISGVTIAETGGFVVTTQISGVYYYTTGSDFTVNIPDMDYLPADSYPSPVCIIVGTEYGLPTLNLAGTDLTGWSTDHDATNASYSKTDWAISAVNYCSVNATGNITATVQDWVAGASVPSADSAICVNTYAANSTDTYEDFRTESRRLTSAWAAWDNTQDLTAYDDNLGLQYQCSRLIYPQTNYTTYLPTSGSQPNYSAAAGTRTYFREFRDDSVSHSNGIFVLGDHSIQEADITADDWLMEISLDGVSWYNCNELYVGGALGNGDGCRIDSGTYNLTANNSIRFTLGTGGFTAAGTGVTSWGIYFRLSWTNTLSADYLGSITISDW